ncbi:MAG: hypothetical protein ACU837_12220 [Gammaproteobacteria bacterium]
MKQFGVIVMLCLPVAGFAQNPGAMMNQEQMQQMLQQLQGMQTCMQNIDQDEMRAFEQRAKQMEGEVRALCDAGKRDEATAKALAFGKEALNNKTMQEMRKCGEGMKSMLPKIAVEAQDEAEGTAGKRHICDQQ